MPALSETECKDFEASLMAEGALIKEYTHFNVYMDVKQYYLGRCFVWVRSLSLPFSCFLDHVLIFCVDSISKSPFNASVAARQHVKCMRVGENL
jgi:hypothetical protein